MSADKNRPHVYVLPEDEENRKLANGFKKELEIAMSRRLLVLPHSGGYLKVLEEFESVHTFEMRRFRERLMVLLIDFDGRYGERMKTAEQFIDPDIADRVFVLGSWKEPKQLRSQIGPLEALGEALAIDCREDSTSTWNHRLLIHNASEIARLRKRVRPILFS